MREVSVALIRKAVRDLCIEANMHLPEDIRDRISACAICERSETAKSVLGSLMENISCAAEMDVPVCQDTGMAVVFLELGQEVHLVGGDLREAVNAGVHDGYTEGYLRCSVVADPLRRVNTGDNTPAVLHCDIVPGDRIRVMVAPKGFGSENMSRIYMLTPAASEEDIVGAVTDAVSRAGSNPCPPVVVGVGIGGNFEMAALLAKRALCRSTAARHPDPYYAALEERMLQAVNALGIGPQGFGGDTTALAVNIETYATHIAGLPVAVNMGCHVTRHAAKEI